MSLMRTRKPDNHPDLFQEQAAGILRCFRDVSLALFLGFGIGTTVPLAQAQDTGGGTIILPDLPEPPAIPPPPAMLPPGGTAPDSTLAPTEQEILDQVYSPEMEALRRAAEGELDALISARDRPALTLDTLIDADRDQVLAFIELVEDFRREIRDKQERFSETFADRDARERLLEEAFAQEGAHRLSRWVAHDNLPTADTLAPAENPTINRFQSAFDSPRSADHLNRKQDFVAVQFGQRQGRKNCMAAPTNAALDREDFWCFEHEPHDWILANYTEKDWFVHAHPVATTLLGMSEEVDGEQIVVDGTVADTLGAVHQDFYGRYDRMMEGLSRQVRSGSIFMHGLFLERSDDGDRHALGASLDSDGKWMLHTGMREALRAMHDYMDRARRTWRGYERAIADELPPLHARALARSVRHIQRIGVIQEPLYARLLGLYQGTPYALTSTDRQQARGTARAQYAAFINQNQGRLDEIAELFECATRPGPQINDLGWQVFHNPVFHIVELADEIAPGTRVLDVDWHVKGQTQGLAIAAPAAGIEHMPVGGGLVLGECGLERDAPEEVAPVEIAEVEPATLRAFGAKNEARP